MSRPVGFGRAISVLVIGLAIASIAFLSLGTVWVNPIDALTIVFNNIVPGSESESAQLDAIVWNIRMPRLIVAAMAGAALGVAGTILQGTFRNPIADAQLVGLSSIASVGALIGFWLGYASGGPQIAVAAGAGMGVVAALLVRWIAARSGPDPSRFILVGVGIGLAVGAVVATASIAIHDPRVPDVSFWFFGGLSTATWTVAAWVAVAAVISVVGVTPLARRLDIMSLGNEQARHVGVDVTRVVVMAMVFIGLGVGATVGAIGVVGFVGLVAGRIASDSVGPHHRVMIPVAAMSGAIFVVGADLIGRLVGRGFEVPVGLITTTIGGAFLVGMILRNKVAT